jgi:NAD(P)-dependent dehydrogenase (short-subunit alcohol dehydrogenase family)
VDLQGKTALVTGGAHRLGRALALALARSGCDVAIHYHASAEMAQATAAEIQALGRRALALPADLTSTAQIESLFGALDGAFSGLDVLVNSAAILEPVDLLDAGEADWQRTIDLNLKAAFFCLQQAARRMRQRGGGAIVNISDVAGIRPWARFPIHSISKAGIEMLTRVAALALAPDIRVNAVAPGPVLKPEGMSAERWQAIGARLPLRRPGSAEDVTRTVLFLLRNEFVTGETVAVDGGDQLR